MVNTDCAACGVPLEVDIEPGEWASEFADADSATQEQMLANLRLLCPYLNIEWKK